MRPNRVAGLWLISVLSAAGAATAAEPDVRVVKAAAEQDRAAVRALLQQGAAVNAARADGATALLWAAHWNDVEMVDLLLRAGANVNAADDYGVTPLARAAENASAAMVERLLKAGAQPNAAQTSGLTPLMIAARTGSVNVVKGLLAHGAHVNAATTETKATALMWAVAEPHPAIVQVLIEGQADVHASTMKGFTPLLYAARNGDIEMAKVLLAAGVSVNETGSDGTHALPYSMVAGHADFAMFLIEQGADPNGAMNGVRALHAAAGTVDVWLGDWYRRHGFSDSYGGGGDGRMRGLDSSRRLPIVTALLTRGADPNSRITTSAMFMSYVGYPKKGAFEPFATGTGDLRGATPLWVAAQEASQRQAGGAASVTNSPEIIRTLLAAGADQRLTTDDGTTPLMVAAGLGRASAHTEPRPRGPHLPSAEQAVRMLIEAGADVNAVNEADFTALHGAALRGLNEVIRVLVDHGTNINARDFKGRTAYRMAEGSKQSFVFYAWPETAELLKTLGADARLGIPGTVQERARNLAAAAAQQQ